MEAVITLLSSMAPHMASELLEVLLNKKIEDCEWPAYDPNLTSTTLVTFTIQINGKHRAAIDLTKESSQEEVELATRQAAARWLEGKDLIKIIFVPGKTINFIIT